MSLLVRLATRDSDILDLSVVADQFTVAIISQGKNPAKSPCESFRCWLSNCCMLRLSRIRPRVFLSFLSWIMYTSCPVFRSVSPLVYHDFRRCRDKTSLCCRSNRMVFGTR